MVLREGFFFKNDASYFIKNNHVYVNGNIITNLNKVLMVGDRVQLEIHPNYYFYFRSQKSYSKYFLSKIRHKLIRMMKPRNNFYKQQSNHIPN